jgi:FkbM family methyltransferase
VTTVERVIPAGFRYRPIDKFVVEEVFVGRVYKRLTPRPIDGVLDLGAHVGAFTSWIAPHVDHVVAVEMIPETARYLHLNVDGIAHVDVVEAAVVVDGIAGYATAYTRGRGNPMSAFSGFSERQPRAGDHAYQVSAVSLPWLLQEWKPSIVKFDIETAEYSVITPNARLLAETGVRELIGELHASTDHTVRLAQELHHSLIAAGYQPSGPAPRKPSGWGKVVHYRLDL